MKKFFAYSFMALSFGVMLASCGGKSTPAAEGGDSASAEVAEQPEEKLFYTDDDVKAIAGLTTFDVKISGITTGMSGENNAKGFTAELTPAERTAENFNEYNKELFNLLKSVASDGKIYADDMSEKTEASKVDDMAMVAVFVYVYKYNGSNIYVTVSSVAEKDANNYSVSVSK